jgi:purine nucleoside phosphorylase
MQQNLQSTVDYIKRKIDGFQPEIGIILGTGLGGLVDDIEIHHQLMYSNIPNFPISTLEFHSGKLIFGILGGKKVVAMQGRLHYYEGYDMKQITFPVRVMKLLGIKKLFVSNASGALNPAFKKGDLMIIDDHINMQTDNPLRGRMQWSWRTTPFLTGLFCLGVSVLILGVGLTLCAWAVPYTVWKLAVRLKLWLSGMGSGKKEQKSSTPSVKDD